MAFALIANTSGSESGGGTSPAITTTGATAILIVIGGQNDEVVPTDSKGNTYRRIVFASGIYTSEIVSLYIALTPTVGASHTFTVAGVGSHPTFCVAAVSGGDWTSMVLPVRYNAPLSGVTVNSLAPGSLTPPVDNCLVIAGLAYRDTTTVAITGGFTITNQVPFVSGTQVGSVLAYLIQTTAAAANPTFSWTTAVNASAFLCAFRVPVAAGASGGAYAFA